MALAPLLWRGWPQGSYPGDRRVGLASQRTQPAPGAANFRTEPILAAPHQWWDGREVGADVRHRPAAERIVKTAGHHSQVHRNGAVCYPRQAPREAAPAVKCPPGRMGRGPAPGGRDRRLV